MVVLLLLLLLLLLLSLLLLLLCYSDYEQMSHHIDDKYNLSMTE